ncbi:hypothetical protein NQ176_g7116 [Zarea fungicola]|uniref:Uncharacterized protein n=1 Tax=Zarea fungicola TaxID=93591 RepID=A0ACC1N0H7_9HYPO|nr:hypothetical protein NQ176_g7116 [Lecanicillium fungicola]
MQSIPRTQATVGDEDTEWHVLPACPEDRPVSYSLRWYTLTNLNDEPQATVPSYLICTRCYADYIKDSVLASRFTSQERPHGSVTFCCFYAPRVSSILWPQAQLSKNTDGIREFSLQRTIVRPCRGTEAVTSDYTKSVGMLCDEIDGFRVCHACFEDRIVDTPFQEKFAVYEDDNKVQWTCHVGSAPYVAKTLTAMAEMNNWLGFIDSACARLAAEECTGAQRQWDTTDWYLPVEDTLARVQICQACYLDYIYYGPFHQMFKLYRPSQDQRHVQRLWSCQLANGSNIGMALALERARQKDDFAILSTAAGAISREPRCTGDGIIGGSWFSLKSGSSFLLCASCHAGLSAFGLGPYFQPQLFTPLGAIVCSLCPSALRGAEFLLKLCEALDRGLFTIFSNHVSRFTGVPACPRLKAASNVKWWGYAEVLFCEECFQDFVADTSLGNSLPLRQKKLDDSYICQIWSARMRALWLEVCAAGEPGSTASKDAVDRFRAIGAHRQQVFTATIMEIEASKELREAKQKEAAFFGQMSVQWSGTAALRHVQDSMNGTSEGLIYGNSSLGYFDTHAGAEAQRFHNRMVSTIAQANALMDPVKVRRLMEQWEEVE